MREVKVISQSYLLTLYLSLKRRLAKMAKTILSQKLLLVIRSSIMNSWLNHKVSHQETAVDKEEDVLAK